MIGMPRHRVLIPLRWSDMDAYGHVNSVQFLRLLEDARVQAFGVQGAAIAVSGPGHDVPPTGLVVARAEIEYLDQLVFRPAPVSIDLWVVSIGAADFDIAYEVLDPGPEDDSVPAEVAGPRRRIYARAETTLVTYDLERGRPRRMTEAERAVLESWRDDPVRWRRRRTPPRPAATSAGR